MNVAGVPQSLARLIPGLWLGLLLCVAGVATPATFALLAQADAGRVVGRILGQEASISLGLGVAVLVLERLAARRAAEAGRGSQFSVGMALALGAIFCTVFGYYGLQPQMAAAKAGLGALGGGLSFGLSFGQLHILSAAFYAAKVVLVALLAWRAAAAPIRPPSS